MKITKAEIDKTKVGLYEKFIVTRTDGKSAPGQKHHGCEYFVLDVDHDPFAGPALEAYANACRSKFELLAQDMQIRAANNRMKFGEEPHPAPSQIRATEEMALAAFEVCRKSAYRTGAHMYSIWLTEPQETRDKWVEGINAALAKLPAGPPIAGPKTEGATVDELLA